jgi:hypothetical protein
MGMDDYIQRLYPEDDIGTHGNYLMLRSYPEYTKRRMASVHSDDKFDDVYTIPNLDQITAAHKGTSVTIGLWIFATDAREPMMDVMIRCDMQVSPCLDSPKTSLDFILTSRRIFRILNNSVTAPIVPHHPTYTRAQTRMQRCQVSQSFPPRPFKPL